MRNTIILIIMALFLGLFGAPTAAAAAHPYAMEVLRWNAAGDDNNDKFYLELLPGSPSWLWGFDGATKEPVQWTLGSGFTVNSGVINYTPSTPTKAFSVPSRSYNSAWQPSTTRDVMVVWSSNVTLSSVVLTAATGTIASKYADNSGISTNVVTTRSLQNSLGGVLATGINPTGGTIVVPAGKWVILTTTTNSGTVNFGTLEVQEIGF